MCFNPDELAMGVLEPATAGRLYEVSDLDNGYVRLQFEPDSPVPGQALVLGYSEAKSLSDDLADVTLEPTARAELAKESGPVCDHCYRPVRIATEHPLFPWDWIHLNGGWGCSDGNVAEVNGEQTHPNAPDHAFAS